MVQLCAVHGCLSKHYGKGFCNKHYQRWRIYGDPVEPYKVGEYGIGHKTNNGYLKTGGKLMHITKVEKIIGKSLPHGVEIHHVDGNGLNNENSNLVVCPNKAYHKLLHRRAVALQESGNPNKRKCCYCKEWDFEENLRIRKTSNTSIVHHRDCELVYNRTMNAKRRHKSFDKWIENK